ncbi:MAG: S4 domain-containing protein, partial [Mycobacteriales bacterium]
ITPGLDGGPKQSKSLDNYVGLAQSAADKFGRLMTLRDDLLGVWARVYTELAWDEVDVLQRRADRGGIDARDAKLDLAEATVARYHGTTDALKARRNFVSVFSERRLPEDVPEIVVAARRPTVLDLVVLARPELTRSAIRRLINDGGVRINGAQCRDPQDAAEVKSGDVLQTGKRRWFTLTRTADQVAEPPQ